jgi:hypothetical protein
VRLARGGLDKQAAILGLIGQARLRVLDVVLQPGSTPVLVGRPTAALRHRGYGRAQAWLSVPPLCDLLAWRAVRNSRFRTTAGRMLSALEDPRSVFSAGALARSFLA